MFSMNDTMNCQYMRGKLLGVLESCDLKWRKHVDATVAKCSTRLYLLRMLRKTGVPRDCLVLFYNAKMRSLLSYAYPAMTNMPKFLLDKLIAVERRATSVTGGLPRKTGEGCGGCGAGPHAPPQQHVPS